MMYYGAQYYRPPFPNQDCWQRDMENMRKLGFTCVKLWAVWNWIEREPGCFCFEDLDALVGLAKQNGLAVILNTIPEGAPYWTDAGNKNDLYRTADGQVVEYGGPANLPTAGWPGHCMDDDAFAGLVSNFIEQTARHFRQEKAVVCIDVWNEPHLEPMFDYRENMLCYCPHSVEKFRNWLQKKYSSIEALNTAWYRTYRDWNEVTPPPRFGTWADMLDWRKFWLDNMRRWLDLRVAACRRGAPDIKVQTHVAYSGILGNAGEGGLGNELGDEFSLARGVDVFGLSSFPLWLMGKDHIYRHFMHNAMVAEAAHGKPFYQVELQGGAGKPGLLGGQVPTARDVALWNWNTVVAGGKGSVYWQYAPEPAGLESPGFGLTGFLGENTPRSLSAGKCAAEFTACPALENAHSAPILNAVYVSRSSDLLCFSAGKLEKLYAGGLSGAFRAAYQKSIPIRFFHQDEIDELPTSGIATLYVPMPLVLSAHEAEKMQQFAKAGGTLVCEACPGLYREDGLLEQNATVLKKLFGLRHVEIEAIPDGEQVHAIWHGNGECFSGQLYRQVVKEKSGVNILAKFEDGTPAVTEYICGKGRAVWIGTYPAYRFEQSKDPAAADAITRWMQPQGYSILRRLSSTRVMQDDISLAPLVRLLETEDEWILAAVNHTKLPVSITAEFAEPQKIAAPESDENTLRLILKAETGTLFTWKKNESK
ncbi:MAG: beta-galactosidase [Gemmiger sp.]|nr:beta-galactosidase [Gemmiger sp.]